MNHVFRHMHIQKPENANIRQSRDDRLDAGHGGAGAVSQPSHEPPCDLTLTQIRCQIDELDAAMVRLMGKRMHLSRQALALKAGHGMALHSPEREQEILERAATLAQHNGLDAALVRNMFLLLLRQYVEPGDNAIVLPLARPK